MLNTDQIDALLLVITLIACALVCYSLFRNPRFCQKKGFTFFLVFLAMYPLLNMVGHLLAISLTAYFKAQKGVFEYDFRFYGLMLYGLVFMLINAYSLNRIIALSRGYWHVYQQLVWAGLLQIVLITPSFVLNPLAALPAMASLLLIGRLYFARRRSFKKAEMSMNPVLAQSV